MTLERILLPVRGDDDERIDRLIEAVVDVASPAETTVTIAHVIPNRNEWISSSVLATPGSNFPQTFSESEYDELLDQHSLEEENLDDVVANQETVQTLADRLEEAGIGYEIRGAVGEPGEALVSMAGELNVDRVIVGGRHRSPTDKILFGSVAQTLLLEAPCPVTLIRDNV
ncbi:universal stress protein [Haloparvum sp. AD34]